MGERLGVDVCIGCDLQFVSGGDHAVGFWGADGRFHWAERAMRRTSIRNFVWRLSARWADRQNSLSTRLTTRWERYWQRVEWAKWALRELHVRLPASAWDQQRATLRALLVHAGAGIFFDDPFREQREVTRKAANRWAKKPIDPGAAGEYDE
jgi:hypothetical protein